VRVLIADDDPVIRKQLEISLIKYGYDITECSNGVEAWDYLQADSSPNLLILDWSMPGYHGLELCNKVRLLNKEPQPYIILLTAKDDINDVVKGLDSGADDYITKPFFPHELRARLNSGVRSIKLQQQLLEARNQLKIEASHDYLTGILNRRAVMRALSQELERTIRNKKVLSLVLFDLDFFKKINDNYGHLVGDKILCETTKRISSALRPYDRLGRYGGEEFLLVLPDCGYDDAYALCQRIRTLICNEKMENIEETISISIGLCVYSSNEKQSMERLLKMTDYALYKAKDNGRNRVERVEI